MHANYYHSQLAHLREQSREFVRRHPAAAGLLSETSGDPDVERLLQGFAYLTGTLHARADAATPELLQAILELVAPQLARGLPACAIVEFTSCRDDPRACTTLPRGSEVAARSRGAAACRFRTTQDAFLLPLALTGFGADTSDSREACLRLRLHAPRAARKAIAAAALPLRLHLVGELTLASALHLWLVHHCRELCLRDPRSGRVVPLPGAVVRPVGHAPEHALLPWPPLALSGPRLLAEYFTLPAKFLFVDVEGLDLTTIDADDLELIFACPGAPALPLPPTTRNVRLGCAPVVNLFPAPAVPIRRDPLAREYLLRPDGLEPAAAEVHDVLAVRGRAGGTTVLYPDLLRAGPSGHVDGYVVVRRTSPRGDGLDASLRIVGDPPPGRASEVIGADLLCTNRAVPAELTAGDLCVPTARSPIGVSFRDISPVTRPVPAALGEQSQWRLLSHLSLNLRSLADPAALREMLGLHDFLGRVDRLAGRANAARIQGVRHVASVPATHMIDRVPVRGLATALTLDSDGFAGDGDIYLFGCVLERLLGERLPVNSFGSLTISSTNSPATWTWPPRSGNHTLL